MNNTPQGRASSAVARLREIIKSMSELWRRSVNENEADAPIDLYVADADVIMLFMAPGADHSYGALLRYDQVARRDFDPHLANLETETATFLADLLFFQLKPTVPVAILPHHAIELERKLDEIGAKLVKKLVNWEAIIAEVEATSSRAYETSRAGLLEAEDTLETDPLGTEHSVERVRELLHDIAQSLRGHGGLGMLFRFDTLIRNDRLRHLDRLPLLDELGATTYLPSPFDADGKATGGAALLERRLQKTMTECGKTKPRRAAGGDASKVEVPRKRSRAIRNDAAALTQLAWLNDQIGGWQYFVEHDGSRRRVGSLVLISGSRRMADAVSALELTELERVLFTPLALLGHRSLDEYVRGSTPEVAAPGADVLESSLMINFLNTMQKSLSRATRSEEPQDIEKTLDQALQDHQTLIASWQDRQLVSRPASSDPVSAALIALKETGTSLDKLRALVGDLSVKAWQDFARAIAFLNYNNAGTGGGQRSIPPVQFAGYRQASAQAEKLRSYASRDEAPENPRPLQVELLIEEDPTHYTEFMCFGLWNLRHRALRTAQGCIEQALTIAEESGPSGGVDRCEALFVQAHLVKLCADAVDDIDRARLYMRQIDTILSDLYGSAAGEGADIAGPHWHGADDIRFAAEDFSIVCHRYYFGALGTPIADYDGTALLHMFERGLSLLRRLPDQQTYARLNYATEYCRQQLLGNLLHLALLVKFGHARIDRGDLQAFIPMEPRPELPAIESSIKEVVQTLIDVCEYLRREDVPLALPRASLLSESLASVGAEVWLGRQELADWFASVGAHWTFIDRQRMLYLDAIRQRQRH